MHTVIHTRILHADQTSAKRWCKAAHGAYSRHNLPECSDEKEHMDELNRFPLLATNYCKRHL